MGPRVHPGTHVKITYGSKGSKRSRSVGAAVSGAPCSSPVCYCMSIVFSSSTSRTLVNDCHGWLQSAPSTISVPFVTAFWFEMISSRVIMTADDSVFGTQLCVQIAEGIRVSNADAQQSIPWDYLLVSYKRTWTMGLEIFAQRRRTGFQQERTNALALDVNTTSQLVCSSCHPTQPPRRRASS